MTAFFSTLENRNIIAWSFVGIKVLIGIEKYVGVQMLLLCGSSVDIASPYSQVSLVPMRAGTPGTWRPWSTRAH